MLKGCFAEQMGGATGILVAFASETQAMPARVLLSSEPENFALLRTISSSSIVTCLDLSATTQSP